MPIIPKDAEDKLRAERVVRNAIKEALRHPMPIDNPERYRIPPSERFDPAERIEQLQSSRDWLLVHCAHLQLIVDALLDDVETRRGTAAKATKANEEKAANTHQSWLALAIEIRARSPSKSTMDISRTVKKKLSLPHGLRQICRVISGR